MNPAHRTWDPQSDHRKTNDCAQLRGSRCRCFSQPQRALAIDGGKLGLGVAKDEALTYLRAERNRLLGLSHKEAIEELIRTAGLDSRIAQVERIEHGDLLGD